MSDRADKQRRLQELMARNPAARQAVTSALTGTPAPQRAAAKVPALSLMLFADADRPAGEQYQMALELARFGDRHGFEAMWIPERHFYSFGGAYASPAVLGAAIATATERLRIRAGAVVLPLHHPVEVVEHWAMLDHLSGGRVDLGVGSGWHPNDFVLSPETFSERREVWFRRIDEVRALWRGEAVAYRNGLGESVPVVPLPRPLQPELPVWLTITKRDDSFIEAGRRGLNVLTMLMGITVEELAAKIALYRKARAEAGLDPATGKVTLMMHAFVGDSLETVEAIIREPLSAYIAKGLGGHRSAMDDGTRAASADTATIVAYAYERYVRDGGLFGSPADAARMIARAQQAGVDEIACLADFGAPRAAVLDSLPALARAWAQAGAVPEVVAPAAMTAPKAEKPARAVAIIGMSGRFPGAADVESYWQRLMEGSPQFSAPPQGRWSGAGAAPLCGFIADAEGFDPLRFRISPREARGMDPHQRLFLMAAWAAVDSAGLDPASLSESRTGVFAAMYNTDFVVATALAGGGAEADDATGGAHCLVANRVSYVMNLRGPSEVVDTACSSGLVAVHRAVRAIRAGECDMALAGGVNLMLSPHRLAGLGRLGILSPDGVCRAFDAQPSGQVMGEGVGVVLLKDLAAAMRDGDPVLAVIRGGAVNHHGNRSGSVTMPERGAQAEVIRAAWADAGLSPTDADYLESHGAGGHGDVVELDAFQKALAGGARGSCAVGSVKPMIGFLEAAGGISQLIKVVQMLRHGGLPPTLAGQPPAELKLEQGPCRIVRAPEPWPAHPDRPRRAGIHAYGLGGTNAHLVVEEAPVRYQPQRPFRRPAGFDLRPLPLLPAPAAVAAAAPEAVSTAEAAIAAMVRDVLELRADDVLDVHRPFSEYGVGSVQGVALLDAVNRAFGTALEVAELYRAPTVAQLAAVIGRARPARAVEAPRPAVAGGAVAVVGMAGLFPGANSVAEFWQALRQGRDCVTEVPPDRWDVGAVYDPRPGIDGKTNCRWGGFIADPFRFDPLFFRLSPAEAEAMDPQQRLLLQVCWQAFEDAGIAPSALAGSRTGLVVGEQGNEYLDLVNGPHLAPRIGQVMIGNAVSMLPARVAYFLDLRGPALAVDTACSSSLVAVHTAARALLDGDADVMLAAGVNLYLSERPYVMMSKAGMLSPTGRCRAFSDAADGMVPGEAVAAVVLKRLEDALADGDAIHGVILGSGINQDGRSNGITAPNAAAQTALELAVWQRAGIDPATISYVEAHGTGTRLGDPVEVAALGEAFRHHGAGTGVCAIGSVKSNIGHASAAAGITGLIKVLLALEHGELPPTLHAEVENSHIDFAASPFVVNRTLRPWPAAEHRRAVVNSFGFSGTNAHVVVEAAPAQAARILPPAQPLAVPLSAADAPALRALAGAVAEALVPAAAPLRQHLAAVLGTDAGSIDADEPLGALGLGPQEMARFAAACGLPAAALSPSATLRGLGQVDGMALADIAHTLRHGRDALAVRAAVVAGDTADLAAQLRRLAAGETIALPDGGEGALAAAWIAGQPVVWPALAGARRLRLPGHPFDGASHRLPRAQGGGAAPAALHPLVNVNVSGLDGIAFAARFDGGEFFLADHVVGGRRILPGMAMVEMARAAGALAGGRPVTALSNVVFLEPVVHTDRPLELRVAVSAAADGARFVISGGASRHAEGSLSFTPAAARPALAVAELRARCPHMRPAAELYEYFVRCGLSYGPAFRAVRAGWAGQGEALAELALPGAADHADFVLNPALLDAATQAVALLAGSDAGALARVPFAVDAITVLAPLPRTPLVHVRQGAVTGEVSRYDLDLIDETGRVCVALSGFSARSLTGSRPVAETARPALLRPVWSVSPLPAAAPFAAPVLAVGAGHWHAALAGVLPAARWRAPAQVAEGGAETLVVLSDPGADAAATVLAVARAVAGGHGIGRIVHFHPLADSPETAEAAAASALLQTLAREKGGLSVRSVACGAWADRAQVADVVARELAAPGDADAEVRWTGLLRDVCAWQPAELDHWPAPAYRRHGVYVITGATGGIGRLLARRLAVDVAARLVLLSRSALAREEQAELERLGAEVLALPCDVADAAAVATALAQARVRFGRIDGVFHAAGVLRDGLLATAKPEDLAAVSAPKRAGALALDAALGAAPLDSFVLFSSAAAAFGNAGQGLYAYANRFLDHFAAWREDLRAAGRRHGRTVAVDWTLWRDGGMQADAGMIAWMEQALGVRPLDTAQAMVVLDLAARADAPFTRLLPLAGDPAALLARPAAAPSPETAPVAAADATRLVRRVLAAELKLAEAQIAEADSFDRFGIDSVLAMQLTRALEGELGELPKTLFFENRTVGELGAHLARSHGARLAPLPPPPAPVAAAAPVSLAAAGPEPIAIIGLAARFPGGESLDAFWRVLAEGRDCIEEIPDARFDWRRLYDSDTSRYGSLYAKWGGFLKDVDRFDPLFFRIAPREAAFMDPQERLFLETAWACVESAGMPVAALKGRAVGVYAGTMYGEYQLLGVEETARGNVLATASFYASVANRVSYAFDLAGPSLAVDTMCSSSLTALHLACQALRDGDCEMALAGGVNLSIHPNKFLTLSQGRFAATDGRCHSFGAGGDGYVPGEGVGAVLLKPLSRAVADGDPIWGVVRGSALNHGGRTSGYTVPNPQAQGATIAQALARAGVAPADISYVEAHGTGTSLGDPIEINGLVRAFGGAGCRIGSVKSNIGHLEGAAGIAGLAKILLQMRHGALAPTLHAEPPNPNIDFAGSGFAVQTRLEPWPRPVREDRVLPRIAGLSSFGAGGANAHVVIEDAPALPPRGAPPATAAVVVLSAGDRAHLDARAADLAQWLAARRSEPERDPWLLHDLAYTLQVGRDAMAERLAVVAGDLDTLAAALAGDESKVLRGQAGAGAPPPEGHDPHAWARAWLAGAELDWTRLHAGQPVRRIAVSTLPFVRERCWIAVPERQASAPVRLSMALIPGHPLVAGHRVAGAATVPGTAVLALALDAGAQLWPGRGVVVRDLTWLRPQPVTEAVELTFAADDGGFTLTGPAGLLARGKLAPADDEARPVLAPVAAAEISGDTLYTRLAANGLAYDGPFRRVEVLRAAGNRAETRLGGSGGPLAAWLDSCLHGLAAVAEPGAGLQVPFALDEFRLFAPPEAGARVLLSLDNGRAAIEVSAPDGRLLCRFGGLQLHRLADPLADMLWRPRWRVAPPVAAAVPGPALVLAETADDPLAAELARLHGGTVAGWDAPVAAPLVYLLPAGGGTDPLTLDPDRPLAAALALLRRLRAALAAGASVRVVTRNGHGLRPGDAIDPVAAALSGMARVAAREHPGKVAAIDVDGADAPATTAQLLAAEPFQGEGEDILLRRGLRWRLWLDPVELPAPAVPPWRQGGVYAIVGGAGGLGQALSRHLAQAFGARLLWIGRRPEDDAIRTAMAAVRALGGDVAYVAADAGDEPALRAALAEGERRLGRLNGAIHAPLVLRDGVVARQSDADFAAAFTAKARSALALVRALAGQPLDFMLVFSSAVTVTAVPGQANYAAGSCFADALFQAVAPQAPWPVRVIDWGVWGEVGAVADAEALRRLKTQGALPIMPAEGMAAIARILAAGLPRVVPLKLVPELRAKLLLDDGHGVTLGASEPGGIAGAFPPIAEETLTRERAGFSALDTYARARVARVMAGFEASRVAAGQQRLFAAVTDVLTRARTAAEVPPPATPLRPLLDACIEALPDVLAGVRSGAEVMFPGGSRHLVEPVYGGSVVADAHLQALADVVAAFAAGASRPLRIVEIGAGTGSATRGVLAALEKGGHPVSYAFTDLSKSFLAHAQAELGAGRPGLEFAVLDIARPPEAQGFALGEADVVIASNVLHATADLSAAIDHAKALLCPGGLLVVNEATSLQDYATLTFGLLPGWWAFNDARLPHAPVLSVPQWRDRLAAAGFGPAVALGLPGMAEEALPQAVIAARSDGWVRRHDGAAPVVSAEPAPVAATAVPPRADVTEQVRTVMAAALGMAPAALDPAQSLAAYGADSLILLDAGRALEKDFGELPAGLLADLGSVAAIAQWLAENRAPEVPPPPPPPPSSSAPVAVDSLVADVFDLLAAVDFADLAQALRQRDAAPERLAAAAGKVMAARQSLSAYVAGTAAAELPAAPADQPLSVQQAWHWSLAQLRDDSASLLAVPSSFRLDGPLDADRLNRALAAVAARHEALRTVFVETADGPRRRVLPQVTVAAHLPAQPDLEAGPLWSAALVPDGDGWRLDLMFHHLVADLWSVGLFVADLSAAYDGRPLPPLPAGYDDFVAWQREALAEPVLAERRDHWRRRLAGVETVLDLAGDGLAVDETAPSALASRQLAPELAAKLRAAARAQGRTPFTLLFATFAVLLAGKAGQGAVPLGIPVVNRPRAGFETVIGDFADIQFALAQLDLEAGAEPLFAAAAAALSEADRFALPFAETAALLRGLRDGPARPPLQACLTLARPGADLPRLGGRTLSPVAGNRGALVFELFLTVIDHGTSYGLELEYLQSLLGAEAADDLLAAFEALLAALLTTPDQPLGQSLQAAGLAPRPTLRLAATFTADPVAEPLRFIARTFGEAVRIELAPYDQVMREVLAPPAGDVRLVVLWRLSDLGPTAAAARLRFAELAAVLDARPVRPLVLRCPDDPALAADPAWRALQLEADGWAGTAAAAVAAGHYDAASDHAGHLPYDDDGFAELALAIARRWLVAALPPCKLALVDADNTLWRGVVGEVGTAGLTVGPAHHALQRRLVEAQGRGLLLAIASKNDPADVAAALRALDMPLRPEHLVAVKAGWGAKSQAVAELAEELSLSPSAFVLIDDNPVECGEVRARFPEMAAIRFPADPDESWPERLWMLDGANVTTAEDARRTEMTRSNLDRARARAGAGSFQAFLDSLELVVTVAPASGEDSARAAQLAQRTNQFNTTLRRYGEAELAAAELVWTVRVADRFGDYGLVGVVTAHVAGEVLAVDALMLSCRVLGRGAEARLAAHLGREALARGLARVAFTFTVGPRNAPALAFLEALPAVRRAPQGGGWVFEVDAPALAETTIAVTEPVGTEAAEPVSAHAVRDRRAASRRARAWETAVAEWADGAGLRRAMAAAGLGRRRAPAVSGFVAPQPGAEADIAAAWAEVLGLDRVGAEDEFFRIGGTSLAAARLVGRLAARLGLRLTLSDIIAHPTVAAMARLAGERAAPAQAPAGDVTCFPLSPAQAALWHLEQGDGAYVVAGAGVVDRALDPELAQRALAALVARHEVLRSTFAEGEDGPVQRIAAAATFDFAFRDLSALPGPQAEAAAKAEAEAAARQGFDLHNGPLVRALVFRLGPDRTALALAIHHLVVDGASMAVLMADFTACYGALERGGQPDLPPLSFHFGTFAAQAAAGNHAADLAYWRAALAPAPQPLPSLADPDAPAAEAAGGVTAARIEPALAGRLRAFAAAHGTTPFAVLLAAWHAVLARHAGTGALCHGIPISQRPPEAEGAVGYFVTTVPLALTADPRTDFAAHAAAAAAAFAGALAHAAPPLARILAAAGLRGAPPFASLFAYQEWQNGAAGFTPWTLDLGRAAFPLVLSALATPDGIDLTLEYASATADAATAARLLDRLLAGLAHWLALPHLPLAQADLLASADSTRLAGWQGRQRPLAGLTLHGMVAAQAAAAPDAIALVKGEVQVSYAVLMDRVRRLAGALTARGVGPGDRVAVLAPRGVAMVVALLAVLESGAAFIPVDPDYPAARIAQIIEDGQPALALAGAGLDGKLPAGLAALAAEDAPAGPLPPALPDAGPEGTAYIIFTSGSTGRPKGVEIPHAGVVETMLSFRECYRLAPGLRQLQVSAAGFDGATAEIFGALSSGGTLVLADRAELTPGRDLEELILAQRVELLALPPSALALLDPGRLAAQLQTVVSVGEALPPELADAWAGRLRLVNGYGPTETSICATTHSVRPGERPVRIGRPLDNVLVRVVDRFGLPVRVGEAGELWLGGPKLARGYVGRPELTAERFVSDGGRWYRSGDMVRWCGDGTLEFLGRRDHQVKLHGHRIELQEIEHALSAHPAVVQAVAEVRDDRLVAWVTVRAAIGEDALRAFAGEKLPAYMRPARIVVVAAMPVTPNGKLDRAALPSPAHEASAAPKSGTAATLTALFARALGRDSVGADDDFFELGGDSIVAAQVVAAARRQGVDLAARDLFAHPTIAALAPVVDSRQPQAVAPAAPPAGAALPLLPIQRWFFAQKVPNRAHWNMAMQLQVGLSFDLDRFVAAYLAVAARQQALHSRFVRQGGGWAWSVMASPQPPVVRRASLDGIGRKQGEVLARRLVAEIQAEFDLGQGRLLGICHLQSRSKHRNRLILVAHHLVIDGVSWRLLLEELDHAYRGHGPALPAAPLAQMAAALAAQPLVQMTAQPLAGDVAMASGRGVARLPFDHAGAADSEGEAQTITCTLDAEVTEALLAMPGAGADDVLLAGVAAALSAWSGDARPWPVAVEGHGRDGLAGDADASATIGWFTTVRPVLVAAADPQAVAAARRAAPADWLRLRYGADRRLARRLAEAAPEVSFNYLGRVGEFAKGGLFWGMFQFDLGALRDPAAQRPFPLALDAVVADGRLAVTISYGGRRFERATMRRFAECLRTALEALAGTGGTPGGGGGEGFPLTPVQRGMALHGAQGGGIYSQSARMRFTGLDAERMAEAWRQLAAAEPLLRLTVHGDRAVIAGDAQAPVRVLDLSGQAPDAAAARVDALADADRAAGFDLARGPLARLLIVVLPGGETELVLTFHHLLFDGWSQPLLMERLFALYQGAKLPAAPAFADFARWQAGRDSGAAAAYWRSRLGDWRDEAGLGLETGHAASARRQEARFTLDAGQTAAVAQAARRARATPAAVIQAALAVLVARCRGGTDAVFGLTLAGRSAPVPGIESMLGMFVNTLPVRLTVDEDASAEALIARARDNFAELQDHEYDALTDIRAWAGLPPDHAVFDLALVIENYPAAEALGRIQAGPRLVGFAAAEATHYPLTLAVLPGETMLAELSWDPARYDGAAMRRLLGHFRRLLLGLAAGQRPAEIAPLDDAEQAAALAAGTGPVRRWPEAVTVLDLIRWPAYAALAARANGLCRALGDVAGQRVALCLHRGPDLTAALLAVWAAGATAVPLDPDGPAERRAAILADAEVALVVGEGGLAPAACPPLPGVPPLPAARPDVPAYLLYTSGSTGAPKGVAVGHGAVVNFTRAMAEAYGLGVGDRVLHMASPAFDVMLEELLPTLAAGAAVVTLPHGADLTPAAFLRFVAEQGVTVLNLPTGYWSLLAAMLGGDLQLPGCVRLTVIGGERAGAAALAAWRRATGGARLLNAYGLTETCVTTTLWADDGRVLGDGVPVGLPLANQCAHVLDAAGRPVAPGMVGELWIGGAGLADGYWRDPARTADRFRQVNGTRLFATGDLARRGEDGALEILGRRDDQVQVRGFRVELGEVEAALEAVPGVRRAAACAAVGALVAYVTGGVAGAEALAALRRKLPAYMVPAAVTVVADLPLTLAGKIDRRRLLAEHPPRPASARPPATAAEHRLAALVRAVLGEDTVDMARSFAEHGGHSLAALALSAQSGDAALPAHWLLTGETLAEVAARLEQAARLTPLAGGGGRPLLLLPGAGGATMPLLPLAQALAPAYAVSTCALGEAAAIDAMADGVVAALRDLPSPLLGGWSMGGAVAFATAARLAAPRGLLLLDSYLAADLPDVGGADDVAAWLADTYGILAAPGEAESHVRRLGLSPDALAALLAQWRRHRGALAAWQPRGKVECPVAYVQATDGPRGRERAVDRWRSWAGGRFRVFTAAGDHVSMLADHAAIAAALAWLEE